MLKQLKNKKEYIAIRGGVLSLLIKNKYPIDKLIMVDWETFISQIRNQTMSKKEFISRLEIFISGIYDYIDLWVHSAEIDQILFIGIIDLVIFGGKKYIDPRYIVEKNFFMYSIDEDSYTVSVIINFLFDIYNNHDRYSKDTINLTICDLHEEEEDFIKYHLKDYIGTSEMAEVFK